MPNSLNNLDTDIINALQGYNSYLDIGCGTGKIAQMVRSFDNPNTTIVGVEVDQEYIDKYQLDILYDTVWDANITEFYRQFDDWYFDCVVMADVIEHLPKSAGIDLLNFFYYRCKRLVIVYPTDFPQGRWEGHKSESHISVWKESDFAGFNYTIKTEGIINLVVVEGLIK